MTRLDLNSVQNLLKKQTALANDIAAHQDRVDSVILQANSFIEKGHFDADAIQAKQQLLIGRYQALQKPLASRQSRLKDALRAQQLFRDIDDEEQWIREKEPIAVSNNRGKDLIGSQNLIKKHQGVLSEIANHEHRIKSVSKVGDDMMQEGHFASEEIHRRLVALNDKWNSLKDRANQRKVDLEDRIRTVGCCKSLFNQRQEKIGCKRYDVVLRGTDIIRIEFSVRHPAEVIQYNNPLASQDLLLRPRPLHFANPATMPRF